MFGPRRRFRRRLRRTWLVGIVIALLVLARWGYDRWHDVSQPAHDPPLAEGTYDVSRVVDGDTLIVRRPSAPPRSRVREIRVRLLGINCPETVKPGHPVEPWGPQAAEFTKKFVAGGTVRLRFDKRRLDKYDRYLAYVFVGEKMMNEELVRAGLADVVSFPGDSDSMTRRLRKAESEAREQSRGMWSGWRARPDRAKRPEDQDGTASRD